MGACYAVPRTVERVLALARRFDAHGPRYTSYPTVPTWHTGMAGEMRNAAYAQATARPVAVYLHLPFCALRCLYCGCNSFITRNERRMRRYADALRCEIERETAALQFTHGQLHLGGGTPTHLPPAMLAEVIDALIARIPGAPDCERSVEIDPRVCSDEHLALLAARGFRRLSIGVQDVEPCVQEAIGRVQPLALVERFVERARDHGFTSIHVDLIYGLPRQTAASWRRTLAAVAALAPDRVACFGYAHLPARLKHQRALPLADLPEAPLRLRMLLDAHGFFVERGLESIGIDHFARGDDALARARHDGRLWRSFMGYTTTRGLELLGFGCSAISELDALYCQNESSPEAYGERVARGEGTVVRGLALDEDDRYRKALINDLMCNLALRPDAVAATTGLAVPEEVRRAMDDLAALIDEGLVTTTEDGLRVTELGQPFLRSLAQPFDRYLPRQDAHIFSRTV